jgi:molecular chaperone DnaK
VREEYLMTSDGLPRHLDMEVARVEFEALITDLLAGTLAALDAALRDAGIEAGDLDRILLVGGSTRLPLVWQMVRDHTGLEPEIAINPDEAVALGAAVQAAIIAGEPLEAILVDVTPHSLGIAVAEWQVGQLVPDRFNVIVPRNTTIPTTRADVYSALYPDQTEIKIEVYQGEHPVASRNTLLGEFLFEHLRPEVPGQPARVQVEFTFDIDGILHVAAVDRGSGQQARMSVRAAHTRLSAADIESARAGLEELEREPWDDEEVEDEEDEEWDSAVTRQPDAAGEALLARARRLAASGQGDSAALVRAIGALEAAMRRGDDQALAAASEDVLDLLYELDEE